MAGEEGKVDPVHQFQIEPLFGAKSRIAMDSLDALQVSLALQQHYGVRIEGAKDGRRILGTIASIAVYIRQQQ